jgi:hypothetical protein
MSVFIFISNLKLLSGVRALLLVLPVAGEVTVTGFFFADCFLDIFIVSLLDKMFIRGAGAPVAFFAETVVRAIAVC